MYKNYVEYLNNMKIIVKRIEKNGR